MRASRLLVFPLRRWYPSSLTFYPYYHQYGSQSCGTAATTSTTGNISFLSTLTTTNSKKEDAISTTITKKKPKIVFLNAGRLDYDKKLDWSALRQLCRELILYPVDALLQDDNSNDMFQKEQTEILSLIQDANILMTKEIPFPPYILNHIASMQHNTASSSSSSIQCIMEAGTGYNNIPVHVLRDQYSIPVCNIPTYSTEAVAHTVITYILNFSMNMFEQQRMVWQKPQPDYSNFTGPVLSVPMHEVQNQTVGLIGGTGRIGTAVAQIALALGMNVIMSSRSSSCLPSHHVLHQHPRVVCTTNVLEDLLPHSDYVSLHTPLNEETFQFFDATHLDAMKESAYLINTSRGGVVHEASLVDALRRRRIQGAGLDVATSMEPPDLSSELWKYYCDCNNDKNHNSASSSSLLVLTPHTGWKRLETRQRSLDMLVDNVRHYCETGEWIHVVN